MFGSYTAGLKMTLASKKMITLIYLTTLFGALILVIPFFNIAKSEMTHSLLVAELLKGFDYTAFFETNKEFGNIISSFISIIKWLGIGYFFFSVVLTGGIIKTFLQETIKFDIRTFMSACGENFWRLFRTSFYNIVIQALLFIGMFIPASIIVDIAANTAQSEASVVYTVVVIGVIHLAVVALFALTADFTKIKLINENSRKVISAGWKSLGFVLKNFKSYLLYLMTMIFPALLVLLYWFVESKTTMSTGSAIFMMLIVQQVFIWTRIAAKIWVIAAEVDFFKLKEVKVINEEREEAADPEIKEPEIMEEIILD